MLDIYIYVCIYVYIYIYTRTHTSCFFLISVAQIITRGHGTFLECGGVKSHAHHPSFFPDRFHAEAL